MLKVYITLIKDTPANDEWESRQMVMSGKLLKAYHPFGVKLEIQKENLYKEMTLVGKRDKKIPPKVNLLIPNRNYFVEVQNQDNLQKEFSYGKLKGYCVQDTDSPNVSSAYLFFDLL